MYRLNTKKWHLLRMIYLIAGVFTTVSVVLGFLWNPYAFLFAGLVGFMQIIFALTGFCLMAILLNKMGFYE